VVRQDLSYHAPIDFRREPYRVRTAVVTVGETSVQCAADIVDPQLPQPKPYASARTVLVQVDSDGRPKPVADEQRRALGA
jgi:acyl-CoA thioester hydrolase